METIISDLGPRHFLAFTYTLSVLNITVLIPLQFFTLSQIYAMTITNLFLINIIDFLCTLNRNVLLYPNIRIFDSSMKPSFISFSLYLKTMVIKLLIIEVQSYM